MLWDCSSYDAFIPGTLHCMQATVIKTNKIILILFITNQPLKILRVVYKLLGNKNRHYVDLCNSGCLQ